MQPFLPYFVEHGLKTFERSPTSRPPDSSPLPISFFHSCNAYMATISQEEQCQSRSEQRAWIRATGSSVWGFWHAIWWVLLPSRDRQSKASTWLERSSSRVKEILQRSNLPSISFDTAASLLLGHLTRCGQIRRACTRQTPPSPRASSDRAPANTPIFHHPVSSNPLDLSVR